MPNFVLINSDTRTIELKPFDDYRDALKAVGLASGSVDYATIGQFRDLSFSIMVYEYGLMRPKQKTYFRLGTHLFNGNAVIYAADIEGITIDFPFSIAEHWRACPEFEFLTNADAAEAAIIAGRANRPQSSINGQVVWSWNTKESLQ